MWRRHTRPTSWRLHFALDEGRRLWQLPRHVRAPVHHVWWDAQSLRCHASSRSNRNRLCRYSVSRNCRASVSAEYFTVYRRSLTEKMGRGVTRGFTSFWTLYLEQSTDLPPDAVSDLSCLATFKRLVKTELYNRAYLRWLVTIRTCDSSLCEWLNVRHQPRNNNNNNNNNNICGVCDSTDSRTIWWFYSAQRLDLFAWCVRLSRLLVGFRTHFKSLHFHSFIRSESYGLRVGARTTFKAVVLLKLY